jgi:hypothetical protein
MWLRQFLYIVFALVVSGSLFAAEEVYIGHLLDDPKPYHAKRVTVVGLAHIDPSQIYLYEDVAQARKLDSANSIFLLAPFDEPFPEKYHRFWVRITGTVDAESHGRAGGIPCEMILEKLEPIHRESMAKLWLTDIGNFRNATGQTVRIGIKTSKKPGSYSVGPIEANSFAELEISDGEIHVVDNDDWSKTLLIAPIKVPPRTNRTDEPDDRAFHYMIYPDRIEVESVTKPVEPAKKSKKAKR